VSNQNTPVDTRVAILEEKFSVYEQMMNKMESAIHTISETCQGISKMLAIHEERIEATYKADNHILEKIKDIENRNTEEHNKVIIKIEKLEEKIESLIKFRWLVGGAIVLVVFVFNQQQVNFMDYLPNNPQPDRVRPVK
jgi:uncharacterized coiled-coil protein SlyX